MISNLQLIQMRALALRSSIHNEHQLSAIELTGMCAKKTNELIDVVNDLVGYVNAHLSVDKLTGITYNETTEELTIGG